VSVHLAPPPAAPTRFAFTFPVCATASGSADPPGMTDSRGEAPVVLDLDLRRRRPPTPAERDAALRRAVLLLALVGEAATERLREWRRTNPRSYFAGLRRLRAPRVQGWARRALPSRAPRRAAKWARKRLSHRRFWHHHGRHICEGGPSGRRANVRCNAVTFRV
jgi:hypothetical protein